MRDQDLSTPGTSMSPADLQALLARAQQNATPPAQPNGGLEGAALTEAVGQAPGPVATTGTNPNNPGPTDIGPNGPSMTSRISDQLQNQQLAGTLPMEPPKDAMSTPDKVSDSTTKKASKMVEDDEKEEQSAPSRPTNSYGQIPSGYTDELKSAQAARDRLLQTAALGKAGSMIGAGIAQLGSGQAVKDNSDWSDIQKMAQNKVGDVLEREKLTGEQLKDMSAKAQLAKLQAGQAPDSDESVATRKALESIPAYAKIIDHMGDSWNLLSAEDIKNNLANPLALYERSEDRKVQYAQMNANKQLALGAKQDQQNYQHLQTAQTALQKDKNYVQAQGGINAADEADSAIDNARTNPAMASAIPTVLARLSTHGQRVNQTEIQNMTGGQSIEQYGARLMNKAANGTLDDQDYAGFKQLVGIYRTAGQKATQQMETQAAARLSRLNHQKPEDNYADLTGKQAPAAQTAIDPETVKFAKAHNMTPEQAQALIDRRKAQQQGQQ